MNPKALPRGCKRGSRLGGIFSLFLVPCGTGYIIVGFGLGFRLSSWLVVSELKFLTRHDMGHTLAEPGTEVEILERKAPLYNVVLLNDDEHSYDYVIEMLQKIFFFSTEQALKHAVEVDFTGRTILITCGLAEAEFSRDQVHAYGPDPRIPHCRGSMSAIIEPADSPPS